MILTDREIRTAIERRAIIIDPAPALSAYSSTSVDLTLDPTFSVFKESSPNLQVSIDPAAQSNFNPEHLLRDLTEQKTANEDGFRLKPRVLALAWSAEYIDLRPSLRLAARVEGKSSLARIGLGVHVTAPTIHAGFDGRIRLEIVNHGSHPIILRGGMKICQLIFEQTLGTPERGYAGTFAGQK